MKNLTNVVETKKVVSTKIAKSGQIESKKIDLLKVVKSEVKKVKTVKVLNPVNFKGTQVFNKEFSKDNLSLGKIRSNILAFNETLKNNEKLSVLIVDLLVKMKVQKNYVFIQSKIQPNKKGLYSSYKLLMFFRTNLELIQNEFNK